MSALPRRILAIASGVSLLALIGAAPSDRMAAPGKQRPADTAPAHGRQFLWRVTDSPTPFYLLGSMHALRGSDYPLNPAIDRAVHEAKRVFLESDVEPSFQTTSRKMRDAIHYPNGVRLSQKVKPETYARIKKLLNTRESDYFDVRPWAIAYFMLEAPGMKDFSSRLSVDRYIYEHSRGHAQVSGLESADELIRAAANLTDAEDESFLLQTIAYGERSPQLMIQTIEAWKTGNVQRMYQLYVPRDNQPAGYWNWIEKRNAAWLPRIETALRTGQPTLVVAGALHFCGPNGLVAQLQKRGHRLEQL